MLETIIIGNVGSLRFAQAGETSVLNISLASSRKVGDREFTDWVSAKIWGERAEKLREHIHTGMKLLLRGRPEAKAYTKGNGMLAGELVLHVNDLEFLSGKPKQVEPHAKKDPTNAEDLLPLGEEPTARSRKRKNA